MKHLYLDKIFHSKQYAKQFAGTKYWMNERPDYYPTYEQMRQYTATYITSPEQYKDLLTDQQNPQNNIIFGEYSKPNAQNGTMELGVGQQCHTRHSLNTLILGGHGVKYLYSYILPNITRMNCSMAISDPTGEIYENTAKMFFEAGYYVKRLDFQNPECSDCYNPLDYLYESDGQLSYEKMSELAQTLYPEKCTSTSFGAPAATVSNQILQAWFIFATLYTMECLPQEERTLGSVFNILKLAGAQDTYTSELFKEQIQEAMKRFPNAKCWREYEIATFIPSMRTDAINILLSRLALCDEGYGFNNMLATSYLYKQDNDSLNSSPTDKFLRNARGELIRSEHNIDLTTTGERKTIIFVVGENFVDVQPIMKMFWLQFIDSAQERAFQFKTRWNIYDQNNCCLAGDCLSKEEAEARRALYAGANVLCVDNDAEKHYYLVNYDAQLFAAAFPNRFCADDNYNGIFEEVYSEAVGHSRIQQYRQATVRQGDFGSPIHVRAYINGLDSIATRQMATKLYCLNSKDNVSCSIYTSATILPTFPGPNSLFGAMGNILWYGTADPNAQKLFSQLIGPTICKIKKQGKYCFVKRHLVPESSLSTWDIAKCILDTYHGMPIILRKIDFRNYPAYLQSGYYADNNKISKEQIKALHHCHAEQNHL